MSKKATAKEQVEDDLLSEEFDQASGETPAYLAGTVKPKGYPSSAPKPTSKPVSYPTLNTTTAPSPLTGKPVVQSKTAPPPVKEVQLTHEQLHVLARTWKDVLVRAGLRIEFAWKFAIALSKAGYDDTNAEKINDSNLEGIGMANPSDRAATIRTIREIADEMRTEAASHAQEDQSDDHAMQKHAFMAWRGLLIRAKLGKEWGGAVTSRYAALLAKAGWDEANADSLTEDDLERAGIANPVHREVILQLVERELAEAMANPDDAYVVVPIVTKEDVDYVRRVRTEVESNLEAFDEFQSKLSKILNGDTESARQARAKREAATAQRRIEREQRRLERAAQKRN